MNKMKVDSASKKPNVGLCETRDEWEIIRECYVKSFLHYPLYTYMVPELQNRERFLRAYLDANYDVTVGNGTGIVIAVRMEVETGNPEKPIKNKTIGGALIIPPSSDGAGWAIGSDEPYWEAYEKYELEKISKVGLERVVRYEAWENEQIAQKASATQIPLWNGLFCAMDPEYASRGFGSAVYKGGVKIMTQHWVQQLQRENKKEIGMRSEGKKTFSLKKLIRRLSSRQMILQVEENCCPVKELIQYFEAKKQAKVPEVPKCETPLVVVISHCKRSAKFHQSNGFQAISEIPFHDEIENFTPFFAHTMILDPLNTGRAKELASGLLKDKSFNECESMKFKEVTI